MGRLKEICRSLHNRKGAIAIIFAFLLLFVFISLASLAIDIGHALVTKNELQNVADASALAATRVLGSIYEDMSYEAQQSYVCDPTSIMAAAMDTAIKNSAANLNITLANPDIIIGTWDAQTRSLTPTLNQPDAVRVIARRDQTENGPITRFFMSLFSSNNSIEVSAVATAALTGLSHVNAGSPFPPLGISRAWFESKPQFCGQPIKFYPTNTPEGCAGWHTYLLGSNDHNLRTLIEHLTSGNYTDIPEIIANQTILNFTGGTHSNPTFDDMKLLFDTMKVLNDGVLDNDTDPNTWTTAVVVYDWGDCSNPNTAIRIAGFATTTILEVQGPPDHTINAIVICDNIDKGRGSGNNYGVKGSIPGLVQ